MNDKKLKNPTDVVNIFNNLFITITEKLNIQQIEKGDAISISGVPRIFFRGRSTNSVEDRGQRERGSWGGSPLARGSGESCNLVQEISFHIVKFS